MTAIKENPISVEAWVSGTSLEDERIRGFVLAISPDGQIAKVHVVESDRAEAVGHSVLCRANRLEALPDDKLEFEPETIRQLIDLALDAQDRVWFEDLIADLHIAQIGRRSAPADQPPFGYPVNRIRT